jgi:ABC-type multidrug transport system fused ATPase/permease subunit
MLNSIHKCLDALLFSDMGSVVATGRRKVIGPEDLPALPLRLDPASGQPDLSVLNCASPAKFLLGLIRAMRRDFLVILALAILALGFDLASPLLVRRLLTSLTQTSAGQTSSLVVLAVAAGLCLASLASAVTQQHTYNQMLQSIQRTVNGLNVRIYHHALRLTRNARTATPLGDLVNHLSTDTDAIAELHINACEIIVGVLTVICVVALLVWQLGAAGLVALGALVILLPVTRIVARRVVILDETIMAKRDERVSLVSQAVAGIRIVKYFAWETRFRAEIEGIRGHEIAARRQLMVTESFSLLFYAGTTIVMALGSFGTYVLLGHELNAPLVFSCVFLFSLLERPFGSFPNLVSALAGARVAADRLIKYFAKETYVPVDRTATFGPGRVSIRLTRVDVRYPGAPTDALRGVSLTIPAGEKVAVVGPVGCGKTTLLATILGELEPAAGEMRFLGPQGLPCKPRLAFAPQDPFILNGTLRHNITFGESGTDPEAAIDAAALRHDLSLLPAGLETEIGEHGVNLSGGQRQRVSLARAVVRRPDLVLLDDPLSAVDESTEDLLIERLIAGAFAGTTLVMTTHRLGNLRAFDRIVFLEAGRIVDDGTFEELEANCSRFRDFLNENERRSGAGQAVKAGAPTPSAEPGAGPPTAAATRITEDEDREAGAVRLSVYLDYFKALGGRNTRRAGWILALLVLTTLALPALSILENSWLARWTNAISSTRSGPVRVTLFGIALPPGNGWGLGIYAAIGFTSVAMIFTQFLFWAFRAISAARNIHDLALAGMLHAKIRFFDATPAGRILNRFSRDVDSVERELTWSFAEAVRSVLWTIGCLAVIIVVLPGTIVLIVPTLLLYYRLQAAYRATARETKRLHSITRSPRFAHFKETLQGLTVVRAFGQQEMFRDEFLRTLGENQRMYYAMCRVNRWFSIRIPLLSSLVSLGVVVGLTWAARRGMMGAGTVGLVLTYTLHFWGSMNWAIRAFSEAESRLTSVERLSRYAALEPEPRLLMENSISEAHRWPLAGDIVFDRVRARYDEGLPEILRGVTFRVPQGASTGIVGRTGSGKSTLFQVLFRLIDVSAGRILIDGHDIRSVPLEVLRRSIAIIPQDPMLFKGRLRQNLDRFAIHTDEEIWAALRRIGLGPFIAGLPDQLDAVVQENGHNFSQGQRQLFCLARALLARAKIIVLDEATASVDVETDSLIQRAINQECRGISRLIIAHRTETLADCDQIVELADGVVVRQYRPARGKELRPDDVVRSPQATRTAWEGIPERPFHDPSGEFERPKSIA